MAVSQVCRGSGPYSGALTPGLGALFGAPPLHGRVGVGFLKTRVLRFWS